MPSAQKILNIHNICIIRLRWGDKSHPNPPLWEIKILSLQGLPIPSTDVNTSYMPFCRVTWNGKEVGSTQKSNYSGLVSLLNNLN